MNEDTSAPSSGSPPSSHSPPSGAAQAADQNAEHKSGQRGEQSEKSRDAYRTISEVAEQLDLPQHVLRFWESKFSQIKPMKRSGNRRYYRPADVELLVAIKRLLHDEGYTIRGVQKLFKEQGLRQTVKAVLAGDVVSSVKATGEEELVSSTLSPEDRVLLLGAKDRLMQLRKKLG